MTVMTHTLSLNEEFAETLRAWIAEGYPLETCGLLLGDTADGSTTVRRVVNVPNLNTERAHDRFELDPAGFQAADAEARANGWDIVGVWHSHPDHPAEPSETDRSRAWEGWSYIIVRVTRDGAQEIRSFRLDGERFVEEDLKILKESDS